VPRRGGAKPGQDIFVTGTLGDAALGLRVLKGSLKVEGEALLVGRFRLPEPRIALGAKLARVASASIDVSDGLMADLGHICEESGVGADLHRDDLPLSAPAHAAVAADPTLWAEIVAGGDDYEILFTASPGAPVSDATRIGRIVPGKGITLRDGTGRPVEMAASGYRHF
jgi:thiamine-monophosphate kinase